MVYTRSQKRRGMPKRATRKNLKNRNAQTKIRRQQKGGGGEDPFEIRFDKLISKSDCGQKLDFTTSKANANKNRYGNIDAADSTRVILNPTKQNDTGYINANYVSIPFLIQLKGLPQVVDAATQRQKFNDFHYIATQGPIPTTIHDFWRMVVENDVNCIVMVTGLVEKRREKCADYFRSDISVEPEGEVKKPSFNYNNIDFYLTDKKEFKQDDKTVYEERTFTYTDEDEETKTVTHLWFKKWPDHGVPDSKHFMELLQKFNELRMKNPDTFKPVVHCSAGVGRTGTFIVLDHILYDKQGKPKNENEKTIDDIICELRQQRNEHMVQTLEQYDFIHYVINRQVTLYDAYNSGMGSASESEEPLLPPPRPTAPKPQHLMVSGTEGTDLDSGISSGHNTSGPNTPETPRSKAFTRQKALKIRKKPSSQAGGSRKSKSNPKTRIQKRRSTNPKNKRTRKSKK